MPIASYLTYAFLGLAIISLWTPWPKRGVVVFYSLSLAAGLISGVVGWQALPAVLLFAGLLYYQDRTGRSGIRVVAKCLTIALVILIFRHRLPGFHNLKVVSQHQFAPDSQPFDMFLNFDKATAGLLLLLFFPSPSRGRQDWKEVLRAWGANALLCVPLVLAGSLVLGYVRADPKWPPYAALWMLNNLVFVCVAEEAFFRGYILPSFTNPRVGLAVSSLLFGAAHYAGGWMYVVLATAAGFFYGRAFQQSGKIEAAILTHFSVNAVHFFFFSYPALLRGG